MSRAENDRPGERPPRRAALSRRALLGGALAAGAGATTAKLTREHPRAETRPTPSTITFYGATQAGIATPQQRHVELAAFDLHTSARADLRALLADWTALAAALTQHDAPAPPNRTGEPPADTGERDGLTPARLTITFGFGPSLFDHPEQGDRYALRRSLPAALTPLPHFRGDGLDPARSDGDLLAQICADDAQVAFHALHALARAAHGAATLRWSQSGFLPDSAPGQTPRNLMGFKDGTRNPNVGDARAMRRHVWADRADGAAWMHGGSYLVVRRIRMLLDVWDATSLAGQERTIGRHKHTGAPLGGRAEHDAPELAADSPIAADAHIRLASPDANHGARLLRRPYSYHDGLDPDTNQLDAGLVFLAYQRDPRRQFVPMQHRLAQHDALARHTLHTASALFACPPGARPGGSVGQPLLDAIS